MPTNPYPTLTCDNCGEVKSALHFPKRSGYYGRFTATDPRRYDNQCKRCRKPARPGQSREDVTEPKIVHKSRRGKPPGPKKPRHKRSLAYARAYKKRVRTHTRIKSMQHLAEKGCEECGIHDPRVLEYDHKNPKDKSRGVARLIIDGYSWSSSTLRKEIRKCRVLCSNCHRKHTVKQQGYYADEKIQRNLGELAARYKFVL